MHRTCFSLYLPPSGLHFQKVPESHPYVKQGSSPTVGPRPLSFCGSGLLFLYRDHPAGPSVSSEADMALGKE